MPGTATLFTFLSTPSARRATYIKRRRAGEKIFLSTPSARRATERISIPGRQPGNFYPRPPRGGRRITNRLCSNAAVFLSTPSARRATLAFTLMERLSEISIHALREEGDWTSSPARRSLAHFYPRPPRGGRRFRTRWRMDSSPTFLSTPSARRATVIKEVQQNCHSISIHALREEGDLFHGVLHGRAAVFLSTPSARRATPP